MTKWSFEVPMQHLHDFVDLQDFHFTLSPSFESPCYREYIQEVADQGLSQLWLDNGFNEKGVADDPSKLTLLFSLFPFKRVVAPDAIGWSTQQIVDSFEEMKKRVGLTQVISVVSDWEMYQELKRIGCKHFAVPYRTRLQRFTLKQLWQINNLHFLGLNNPTEVIEAKPQSCDTSMPIKLGLRYIRIEDWVSAGCFHLHTADIQDYFSLSMNPTQINIARQNIKWLKEVY